MARDVVFKVDAETAKAVDGVLKLVRAQDQSERGFEKIERKARRARRQVRKVAGPEQKRNFDITASAAAKFGGIFGLMALAAREAAGAIAEMNKENERAAKAVEKFAKKEAPTLLQAFGREGRAGLEYGRSLAREASLLGGLDRERATGLVARLKQSGQLEQLPLLSRLAGAGVDVEGAAAAHKSLRATGYDLQMRELINAARTIQSTSGGKASESDVYRALQDILPSTQGLDIPIGDVLAAVGMATTAGRGEAAREGIRTALRQAQKIKAKDPTAFARAATDSGRLLDILSLTDTALLYGQQTTGGRGTKLGEGGPTGSGLEGAGREVMQLLGANWSRYQFASANLGEQIRTGGMYDQTAKLLQALQDRDIRAAQNRQRAQLMREYAEADTYGRGELEQQALIDTLAAESIEAGEGQLTRGARLRQAERLKYLGVERGVAGSAGNARNLDTILAERLDRLIYLQEQQLDQQRGTGLADPERERERGGE
jgi:hypothetical protein